MPTKLTLAAILATLLAGCATDPPIILMASGKHKTHAQVVAEHFAREAINARIGPGNTDPLAQEEIIQAVDGRTLKRCGYYFSPGYGPQGTAPAKNMAEFVIVEPAEQCPPRSVVPAGGFTTSAWERFLSR